ncbi:hypothetical protein [Caballeronia sp. AZ7_KS35]|uniref:hypothetical protein n=1 Tax=Caballeronia sp. AZ7_KS35 TaxID=2921762 RepID=UPI002027FFDF|nr:hypothetical protein [Caballeronia sp. AZ7_KS35]
MNRRLASIIVASTMLAATGAAQAKGCLKGAAVGGVAGHVAGGHGTAGAIGGCAIGHHEANKKDKQAQQAQQANAASAPNTK